MGESFVCVLVLVIKFKVKFTNIVYIYCNLRIIKIV